MKYSIRQLNATTWQLIAADGSVVGTFEDAPGRTGYSVALSALSALITTDLAIGDAPPAGETATTSDGLLPEEWGGDIAFSEKLPGGRDFTGCAWSWRDPATQMIPLMWLDTSSEYGHLGAQLAGLITAFSLSGGTVSATGRYFDSEMGRYARDLVAAANSLGATFPVSVDPTEDLDYEFTFECVQWDEEGFCEMGEESVTFHAYEIGGLTGCPIPGFGTAGITNSTTEAAPMAASALVKPVRAALSIPTAPPRAWMTLAEPRLGQPWFDGLSGDDVLVPQWATIVDEAGIEVQEIVAHAVPVTLRDEGLVYGHLTYWGQCHTGDPWGPGICAAASPSSTKYADFYGSGHVVCDDGTDLPAGVLTVGCEHSSAMGVEAVRDHYAHAGLGWASVRIVDGEYGPWFSGVLRPDLTEQQVAVLRRLSLSGDWVGELAGILAVNTPGLPVQRALAASAFPRLVGAGENSFAVPQPVLRASAQGGKITKLVGANIVRRCPECEQRALAARAGGGDPMAEVLARLKELSHVVRNVEFRTRGLIPGEADAIAARLRRRATN